MQTDESLLKKTLTTVGILVGACVAFIGTLTVLVLFVVGKAVGPLPDSTAGATIAPQASPATQSTGGGGASDAPRSAPASRRSAPALGKNQPI